MMDRQITPSELLEVWQAYVTFRQGYVSASTVARDYAKIEKRILAMKETSTLNDAMAIRQWCLNQYSSETARRTLVQFNAATAWGEFTGLLPYNPFLGLTRYLSRRQALEENYVAFSVEERDTILVAFEQHRPFYLPWVQFLFWTGCRPEEAAALRWEHIAADYSQILIREAMPADTRILGHTKNYRVTRFPVNERLARLLRSLRSFPQSSRDQFLFAGPRGAWFDYHNFQARHWKPMVTALAAEGAIAFYLSQYHARHTFITEALKHMDVKTVSYLCRVSESVLMKHYMSRSRVIEIPEF